MLCFEFVAKLAFENFVAMAAAAAELDLDIAYQSPSSIAEFEFTADTAVDRLERMAAVMAA